MPCRRTPPCGARFFDRTKWYPTQWAGRCDGVHGTLLEVFVTDTRQRVLAACEKNVY